MKKEVTIKVPPQKAYDRKETKVYCDICGVKVVYQNYGGGGGACCLCKRDVCVKHKEYDPHEPGDYPDKYCTYCYDLKFGKYQELADKILAEYDRKNDNLDKKIKEESLAKGNHEGI